MSDFVDSSAFRDDASAKAKGKENKLSLSLSRKKKSQAMSATSPKRSRLSVKQASGNEVALNNTRFEFKKTDSYKEMSVRFVPQNTKKNNNWAYNNWAYNFQSWRENRNREFPDEQCPFDLIESPPWDCSALSYWLARFGCETRNALGRKYPATTVFSLLSALLRQMRVIDGCYNPDHYIYTENGYRLKIGVVVLMSYAYKTKLFPFSDLVRLVIDAMSAFLTNV